MSSIDASSAGIARQGKKQITVGDDVPESEDDGDHGGPGLRGSKNGQSTQLAPASGVPIS